MAKSNALTDTIIKKAKPATFTDEDGEKKVKPTTLTDGRGLYLLVQPTGGKLWRYKFAFDGKPKLMALGSYPVVTLAMAREKHLEARRLLSSGVDPMAQRKEGKAAEKAATEGAFANVATLWLAHWRLNKSPRHVDYTERRMKADILPALGARHITEIEAPELVAMAKQIEARGARDVAKRALNSKPDTRVRNRSQACDETLRSPAAIKPGLILKPTQVENMARVDVKELPALLRASRSVSADSSCDAARAQADSRYTFVRPS